MTAWGAVSGRPTRRIRETDEANVATAYGYDNRGLLASVTLDAGGSGAVTTYLYDDVGNLTSQTDPLNHTTSFQYDYLARRTRRTLPYNPSE
jgi:YD repeat-containing protein